VDGLAATSAAALALAAASPVTLSSPVFRAGQTIPTAYTCEGRNVSPPLRWTAPPRRTRAFALVVSDLDAPGRTFRHWIAWGIPAAKRSLRPGERPPRQGRNDAGGIGYTGPCPPPGSLHRYVFRLYALDANVGPPFGRHVVAVAQLTGRFGR
jgi:Raf kinase inhibitor-like YbhB/YbcL family protein